MLKKHEYDLVMDYESFCTQMKKLIAEQMGEDYQVDINHVQKNNSVCLDGLVILKKGENVSPNFYLKSYFERYERGEDMNALISDIVEMYECSKGEVKKFDIDFSFENCKDRIIYRLVSAQMNEEQLEKIPHIPLLDLAITFYCLMSKEEDSVGTVCINENLQKNWNVSTKELFQLAQKNTARLFPVRMTSLYDLVMRMAPEEMKRELMGQPTIKEPYILTNEKGMNGAAAILYQGILLNFARQMETNLFILPSSIHEVLVIPEHKDMEPDDLCQMVQEVNRECVTQEEFLSNQVYRYLWKEDRLEYA